METDKILWLDGHTTTIPSAEASENMHEELTDKGYQWVLKLGDDEFIWLNNQWMQL